MTKETVSWAEHDNSDEVLGVKYAAPHHRRCVHPVLVIGCVVVFTEFNTRRMLHAAILKNSLLFEPTHVSLGTISPDDVQNVAFKISNNTTSVADAIVIQTSCGCTVAKDKFAEIKPGEAVTLNTEFNPHGRKGPSEVFVFFEYQFSERKFQTLLSISADISKEDGSQ